MRSTPSLRSQILHSEQGQPMTPVLHDAVLLLNFAKANALGLLRERHGHRPGPRWVAEVHSEVERGASLLGSLDLCRPVLGSAWLGDPEPASTELAVLFRYCTALGGQHPQHLGEAASVRCAELIGGLFATDDNAAYDWAERRLGVGRAIDTVRILEDAVAMGETTAADAAAAVESIRADPSPRSVRRVHPDPLRAHHLQ